MQNTENCPYLNNITIEEVSQDVDGAKDEAELLISENKENSSQDFHTPFSKLKPIIKKSKPGRYTKKI